MGFINLIRSIFKSGGAKTQYEGFIKFFNRKKGYGFINADHTSKDIFVHVTDVEDKVKKGDKVKFNLESSQKGLVAKNVELLDSSDN